MKIGADKYRLQYITNGSDVDLTVAQAINAISGGCRWVQIRMKDASDNDVIEAANRVKVIACQEGAVLVLDDRVELVKITGVDGVHLGKCDMDPSDARALLGDDAIIGVTVNTLEDILFHNHNIIDYMGMGPFRFTKTKKNLAPVLGSEGYRSILGDARLRGVTTPVIAIGGITIEDVAALMDAGVDGVAISGAIANADDPVAKTGQFLKILNQQINKNAG